jgi:hypothetical protein
LRGTYGKHVSGVSYRQGQSYAIGTIIDGWLTKEDETKLYSGWDREDPDWPSPLMFAGGVEAITCEKVLQVPTKKFNSVYGVTFSKRVRAIAESHKSS